MTSDSFPTQSFEDSEVELLELYLAGKLTGSAAERVERWMAAHKDAREVVEMFRGGVVGVDTKAPDAWEIVEWVRARRGWHDRRKASVSWAGHATWKLGTQPLRQRRWSMVTGLTVAVLLVLALFREIPWVRHTEFYSRTTYTTAAGQRANIELRDGTHIILAPATRLEIPEDFARRSRTVRLSGEAYFDVAHTAGMPFVVEAGKVRTVVLGTAFGVRAYHRTVQLAVRSGRVAVNGTVLNAHDIARVTSNSTVTVLHDQSLDAVLGFAAGRLVLTDMPLQDAIESLDRWCDVNVQLGDPALARLTINAILTDGSMGELLEMFQVTYGLHVVHVGRTITLYPR
jgi:transmembrane sensor